jgi:hypothetical protein
MDQFWHPELRRELNQINAQYAQILERLKGIGAQNDQILANQQKELGELVRPPAAMFLTIKGDPMSLSIDSVNSVAVFGFEDRDQEAVAPPAGTLAVATSDNTAVMTVSAAVAGTDANGVPNIQFPLTEVSAGTSTLSVTATDASGNPLLGPDGVTPIPAPAPVVVTVNPGAPAAEVFTVPGD